MRPTLYLLIGAKGSGKTYIGNLLEDKLGIPFLRIEQRHLANQQHAPQNAAVQIADGFPLEEKWIADALQNKPVLISEATGSSVYLKDFIKRLRSRYKLKLIRVFCPLDICFERVKTRSQTHHFVVSDLKTRSINHASHHVVLPFDFEIDNTGPATDTEILKVFTFHCTH